jgi:hypothetical protein
MQLREDISYDDKKKVLYFLLRDHLLAKRRQTFFPHFSLFQLFFLMNPLPTQQSILHGIVR